MDIDYLATGRQTETKPRALGRVQRVEDVFAARRVDIGAGTRDCEGDYIIRRFRLAAPAHSHDLVHSQEDSLESAAATWETCSLAPDHCQLWPAVNLSLSSRAGARSTDWVAYGPTFIFST